MTAEIGILNKTAVALAADSAVTIGGQKIYNSANKLFTLSKHEPVGVMIYGDAQISGVPWETIIKLYRAQLGKRSFSKLEGYCEDFIAFLNSGAISFAEQDQNNYLVMYVGSYFVNSIRFEIEGTVEKSIEEKKGVDTRQIVASVIEKHYKLWEEFEAIPGFTDEFISVFKEKYETLINNIADKAFDKLPLTDDLRAKLISICINLHVKDYFKVGSGAGIVFAGFGVDELYPVLQSFNVECVVCNKMRLSKNKDKSAVIDEKCGATIIPFAQDEMVHTVITGIDPLLDNFSKELLFKIFNDYPAMIFKKFFSKDTPDVEKLKDEILKNSRSVFEGYVERLRQYTTDKHVSKIVDMVAHFPKDELAIMAETLVNLTSFKRRITKDKETVGGPIDVAVISKGDGFIWIKRKHYFDAELNPNFLKNYFGGNKYGKEK